MESDQPLYGVGFGNRMYGGVRGWSTQLIDDKFRFYRYADYLFSLQWCYI